MAYSEALADRVTQALAELEREPSEDLTSKKMFGGLCFLLSGKILVGVGQDRILVRVSDSEFKSGLASNTLEPMNHNGRVMGNFAYVTESSFSTEGELLAWIVGSRDFLREHMIGKPAAKKWKRKL